MVHAAIIVVIALGGCSTPPEPPWPATGPPSERCADTYAAVETAHLDYLSTSPLPTPPPDADADADADGGIIQVVPDLTEVYEVCGREDLYRLAYTLATDGEEHVWAPLSNDTFSQGVFWFDACQGYEHTSVCAAP